mmetsp:Transcript_168440/g.323719  ORF Transcript_168440/g.323719 Transcript_168440/m.323719 type:complete len:238 (-) Transcript_168440:2-715(-)
MPLAMTVEQALRHDEQREKRKEDELLSKGSRSAEKSGSRSAEKQASRHNERRERKSKGGDLKSTSRSAKASRHDEENEAKRKEDELRRLQNRLSELREEVSDDSLGRWSLASPSSSRDFLSPSLASPSSSREFLSPSSPDHRLHVGASQWWGTWHHVPNNTRPLIAAHHIDHNEEAAERATEMVVIVVAVHAVLCLAACGYYFLALCRDLRRRPQPTYLSNRRDGALHNIVARKKAA